MNKLSRLLFATIMFLGISLSSCSGGNKSWNYTDEELKNAVELETIVQLDDKLRISISSEDNFFKHNISKEAILIAPKINEGEGEEITFKELKKARIEDFTFKQIDRKNIVVTLEEYSSPAYYVYFDKSASTENKVALATISLYIDTKGGDPIFALDERTNYLGASNPDFVIHYSNAQVDKAEPSYVELSDAFKDLQIKSVVPSKNIITIHTSGTISQALKGIITLKEGFFNDVKKDVNVVSDIVYSVASIDQASYKLEDNKLSFDIRSISLDFEPGINSSQLSINIEQNLASIDKVTYKNENTINVSLSLKDTYTSINDALSDINNSEIVFNDVFKGIDGVFPFKINVQFPAISIYPQLFKRENRLVFTVYLRHAQEVELVNEDITLYDSNIILEGDSKNAEIEQFDSLNDGFTMSIKLNEGFGDDAYGYIRINLDKVTTKWGTIYSVFEKFDSETVVSTNWTKKEMETYKMNVLSYSSGPFVHKFIMSVGYTASAVSNVITKGVKGVDGAISSALSIFSLWGFTTYNDPTCADVLNKLGQVEQEVYSATQKLNSFSESMEKELSYLRYGIDNIAYEQYKSEWTKFNKDYVEAMNDIIRTNKNKYFKEFVDAIKAVDEYFDIRVYYHIKDGKYVYTLADPNDPYMSVEGLEIKKSHRIRIPVSYLQPLLDEINGNGGYTSNVPTIFEACVKSFLADNEHIASRVPYEAIKGTFDLMLEMKTMTKEDALDFNNIFMDYANQIAGNNGTGISALSSYYKMMEGMYNFQSETKDVFKDFRTDQKNDFDTYANYNNTKRVLAGIEINLDEFNEAYEAASKVITKDSTTQDVGKGLEYSYVAQSKFDTAFIKMGYSMEKDANNKQLVRTFYFVDGTDGTTEADYVDFERLISQSEFYCMFHRYQNMLTLGIPNVDSDFITYCINKAGLDENCKTKYSDAKKNNKDSGQELPDVALPVLCSFDGADLATKATDFTVQAKVTYDDKSSYFTVNNNYTYGSSGNKKKAEADKWKCGEAQGTVINLADITQVTTTIDRYATYSESHSYWSHDENWMFEMYGGGFYCYVFYRVA